jgi:hypothetical protein
MLKSSLIFVSFFILFTIHDLCAQDTDVLYLYDGNVVLGEIKKPAYPLRDSKIEVSTDFGQQSFFLDQVDSVKKDGIMYKKLSYRLGRMEYQSLGKPYFKGQWTLYETDIRDVLQVQIMEVDGVVHALTEDNFWKIMRVYIDKDYETKPIKEFKPVLLSWFSQKYHLDKDKEFKDIQNPEDNFLDVRAGFGLVFNNSNMKSEASMTARGSFGFSLNVLFVLKRIQFETYYRFDKMPIETFVNSSAVNFEVRKNEFALLANYMLLKGQKAQPYIQVGALLMGERAIEENPNSVASSGLKSFTYDAAVHGFVGGGVYFNFKPIGFAINYRRSSTQGEIIAASTPQEFDHKINTIAFNFYF